MLDRQGAVPRSTLYLAFILLAAAAVLFFFRPDDSDTAFARGGPIFQTPPSAVQAMLVTTQGVQYRLEFNAAGIWTLSGAYEDFLDQASMSRLLTDLAAAQGGRLLPGTEPEDRRYNFNAPAAIRVTLLAGDGTRETLAIGGWNPVTKTYFASGAGRSGCFPVPQGLYERLRAVPRRQLLQTLLPSFAPDQLDSLDVWDRDRVHHLTRRDGRWWLRLNPGDEAQLGPVFQDLNRIYGRRLQVIDGQPWALANDQEISRLIHDASRVVASEVYTGQPGAEARLRYGFNDPWRRVSFHGVGINPDPGVGSADRLDLVFGHWELETEIPVARRGVVLLTSPEAVISLKLPLVDWLDLGAMPVFLAEGDSLEVWRAGELALRGHRDRTYRRPGKDKPVLSSDQWQTLFPPRNQDLYDEGAYRRMTQSLLVNLDRTPILAVLPPTEEPPPLLERERLRLTVWFEGENGPRPLSLVMGWLDETRLPAGSPELVQGDDNLPPAGLWNPATGQLLQVPGYTLTTVRSWQP